MFYLVEYILKNILYEDCWKW